MTTGCILENIPKVLKKTGLFCCWRYEERNGRKTKVPYQPEGGAGAKSNDPSTFATWDIAVQVMQEGHYDGIGVGIFNGICAIDLDHCISDSGSLSPTAAEIVELMHSWTEVSPSGEGLHIFFLAEGFQYDTKCYYIMNHKVGIEVYVAGATSKYVTVTGQRCEEALYDFGDRTRELEILLEKFMRRSKSSAVNAINAVNSAGSADLSIDRLLEKARSSRNGTAFGNLWDGSIDGYPSHSEADMALCSMLAFWTGRDAEKMDAMFRQSGLMREKWDRPQSGSTYGRITIQNAIANCSDYYSSDISRHTAALPDPDKLQGQTEPVFQPLIPLVSSDHDLPSFPVDALPYIIGEYVNAVAANTETSPDMAAVISLGVLASCLQGKYEIEGKPGYCEPLSLYIVIIAPSGERKSSALRAMCEVLYDYESEYNLSHAEEIRRNHRNRASLERKISSLQKKLDSKAEPDGVKELELQQLQDQLEEMPVMKEAQFIADDVTPEALVSKMADNRGIMSVISSEAGTFDMLAGRYSSKPNFDIWLKGYCGDPVRVDRKNRESEFLRHPTLSTILTIQPSVLDEIMSNTTMAGRGLLARFLYASPPTRVGKRKFQTEVINEDVCMRYRLIIFELMKIEMPDHPLTLHLEAKAFELIAEFYEEHEKFLSGEGQDIREWACKYFGTVLRIAGLLHCADAKDETEPVTAETVVRAIRIGKYFLAQARYAYSVMGADLNIQKATFVLAKLKKAGLNVIKRQDLFQMCRGKFFKKTEDIFETLDLLAGHGYIYMEEPARKAAGRPADIKIHVNPQINQ